MQAMNTENVINSIYNPKKKTKDSIVFPKILKPEATPPQNKVFIRGASRKYNQNNIFKLQDQKPQKIKLRIEQQKLKEIKNKDYEQLEAKLAELTKKHEEEMRQIQQREKQMESKIQGLKKGQYEIKLSIWQIRNDVMNLNGIVLDQQAEMRRLEAALGAAEDQYQQGEQYVQQQPGQGEEIDENDCYEDEEEMKMSQNINILHSLSLRIDQPNEEYNQM